MSTVLITDGEQRASLAAVRSLGAAGHRAFVCGARGSTLAGGSRFAAGEAVVADPLDSPERFVESVEELVARWGVDTLLPMSEGALRAILPERERFRGVRIPFASYDRFLRISDKAAVMEAAREVGIRVPAQRTLASREQAAALPADLRFPLVVKPARSVVDTGTGRAKTGVAHAQDSAELRVVLDSIPGEAYPLLLQERIVGPGIGIFLLISSGAPAAAFAHRRLREKPVSGGVSVYRESVPLDPDLLERSVALLAAFSWEGVAMVEYKRDAATGTPYIMEINGRFWGSLQLAIDAGVDFPRLLVEDAGAGEAIRDYRIGVRSRWEWGDVDHLVARLRHSSRALALPPGEPGRASALAAFFRSFGRSDRAEVFRISDPRPFLRETRDWVLRR